MSLFSDPQRNVEAAGIVPGLIIADFGAGAGLHTIAASRALATTGRVYAIDVNKDLLDKIATAARDQNLSNIDVIYGDVEKAEGSQLTERCIDLVMVSNLLFQVKDKQSVLIEAKRILNPGGRVLVVDWSDGFGGIGPTSKIIFDKNSALQLFEKSGFALDREFTAGSHHYGMIFKKL